MYIYHTLIMLDNENTLYTKIYTILICVQNHYVKNNNLIIYSTGMMKRGASTDCLKIFIYKVWGEHEQGNLNLDKKA